MEQGAAIRRPGRSHHFGLALLALWAAALVLHLTGLASEPLRDWDEAIVARVALELSQRQGLDQLLPTFWGEPYLNKPPGLHVLIAGAIHLWRHLGDAPAAARPPAWLVRLPPALIASVLPPLLALVQRRLRPTRPDGALATGAISLSLLPLVRHGHLAMLDGSQLVAMVLVWLGLLAAGGGRHSSLAGGLLAGAATGGLLLLKAPVALPVLAGAVLLRALDGELRGPDWRALVLGLALGLLPGLGWHGLHGLVRGPAALHMWTGQGLARVTSSLEEHQGGPLPPLVQVLTGGWPWLPLWPVGLAMAWRRRQWRDGRWALGLTLLASGLVLPLQTQLPWYSLLLWPPFALVGGPVLADLVANHLPRRLARGLGGGWALLGGLLLLAVLISRLPGLPGDIGTAAPLALPAGAGLMLGGGLLAAGPGLARRWRQRGVLLLLLGWCGSLLLLFASPLWHWELNEQPLIAPLLPLVEQTPASGGPLLVSEGMERRISLAWSAGRPLRSWPPAAGQALPPGFALVARADGIGAGALPLPSPPALVSCKIQQPPARAGAWAWWWCDSARSTK
ncbi:MAG: hypothetical protein VKN13_08530 [Cyanobacteriota bacterium]|nr:hypothetical protein [Cyanobacteriota bacterium]